MSRAKAELGIMRAVNYAPMPTIVLRVMLRRIAKEADAKSLSILANNLDLPMDDAESVDFLRHALIATYEQMKGIAKEKLA